MQSFELNCDGPIGIFDSGVGGLSVWRELVRCLPQEDTVYFADQAHVPYGQRTPAEIDRYSLAITRFLLARGCKAIVVACNTASATSLEGLRDAFPEVPIVGLEPAIKPAVALTHSGVVGVLATPPTLAGHLFQTTAQRYAEGVRLITAACAGLAERIDAGAIGDPATREALREHLGPMLAAGADVIVLACTHYPFVRDTIQALAGPACQILDPAPAIARQVGLRLALGKLAATHRRAGQAQFYTSGMPDQFAAAFSHLIGSQAYPVGARWVRDALELPGS